MCPKDELPKGSEMLDLDMKADRFNSSTSMNFHVTAFGGVTGIWAEFVNAPQMFPSRSQPTGALPLVCFHFPAPQVFKMSFMSNGRAH